MNKLDAKARKAQILAASLKAAETVGYTRVTLQQIADAAQVSKGLPITYFGTMDGWRRDVMREAIRTQNLRVLAQGLAARDRRALKAPEKLKIAALATCR